MLPMNRDKWIWKHFPVASSYLVQNGSLSLSLALISFQSHIISLILGSWAPSKIIVYSNSLLDLIFLDEGCYMSLIGFLVLFMAFRLRLILIFLLLVR